MADVILCLPVWIPLYVTVSVIDHLHISDFDYNILRLWGVISL